MVEWKYKDYRPQGFECWEADWGTYGQYQIAVSKIGESRYTVRWYYKGMTDIKEHIDAMDWDEAKVAAISIVKDYYSQRAAYWRDMKIGFNNWVTN